ncbi:MAG: beta-lactamase family protein [Bacteroidales bacterium]|nr:beta-lactamase family protein [Bacteroidales bacterium]
MKNTRYFLVVIVLFTLFSSLINSYCQSNHLLSFRGEQNTKRIIEHYDSIIPVLMKEQNIPALSIAIVDQDGMIWSNSFGNTATDPDTPNTPETMFSIQSVSKTFTATAIMMAVDEGLLDLDTPVSKYIPEFRIKSYYDKEPLDLITLRHLLSHTAGLAHEAPLGNNFTADSPSFEEHVNSIQQTSLRYPVGQRFCYSNLGMDLAAYILQEVSGQPFHQYLQERIFDPLGMTNSSADPEVILNCKSRAPGHSRGVEEKRVIVPMTGAGGVYTSIDDMAKFVQFHLNQGKIDGKELITPSLLEEMYTVPFPVPGQIGGYALGIDTYKKYNAHFLNHGGGGYGFLADMAWYGELGIGAVVLTNSVNHTLQGKLYNEILDKLIEPRIKANHQESDREDIQEFKLMDEQMQLLSGHYLGRSGSMNIQISEGSLGVENGQGFTPFGFYSVDEAILPREGYNDYFRFVLDAEGKPDYLVKLNGGRTWDFNDGPFEAPGPDLPQWEPYLGDYGVYIGGNPVTKARFEKKNGYLYLTYMNKSDRLAEAEPGVLISSTGEILQFGEKIEFASIFELVRMDRK